MTRMKKMLLSLAFLLAATVAQAVPQRTVSIYQKDGQVVAFAFSEKPVVSYDGNNLVLTTTKTTVQFPIYQLKKLQFDDDWVNSDDNVATTVEQKQADVLFGFHDGMLTVSGGEPGAQVTLYSVKGMMVGQWRLDDAGCATIPMQGMGKDVYIVKTNRLTFKFRKS